MTLSVASIESSRLIRSHWEQVNRQSFDRLPVGAKFRTVHRRSRILEGVFFKVGADTVNDCGTMRSAAIVYRADLVVELLDEQQDAERFE